MRILYYIILMIGGLYFIFKKRKFDIYTFSFFSSVIYFAPGILGHAVYPGKVIVDLDPRVYIVFSLVVTSIILAAFIKDNKIINIKFFKRKIRLKESRHTLSILITLSIVIMIYQIITINKDLFSSKAILLPKLGIAFMILRITSGLSLIISVIENNKKSFFISIIPIIYMFLVGSRSAIALPVLAIAIIKFKESKKERIISYNFKYIILILLFGYIMVMGKSFYGHFKREGILVGINALFNKEFIIHNFSSMEPFGIQAILNEIIVKNFHTGFEHLKDIIYQLLIIPSLFSKRKSFNEIFQSQLFPEANYGMAYNIWAESISSGGFGFLIIVVIIYVLILFVIDRLMESSSSIVKGTSALIAANWGFYIHRNSIETQLTFTRHIIYVVLISLIISIVISIISRPFRINSASEKNKC